MSSSRLSRLSWVSTPRSCASVKSADTQCSARWSLHEQVFSSGFTNIAFNKVRTGRRTSIEDKKCPFGRGSEGMAGSMTKKYYTHSETRIRILSFITGVTPVTFRITSKLEHSLLVVLQSAGDWGRTVHVSLVLLFCFFFTLFC